MLKIKTILKNKGYGNPYLWIEDNTKVMLKCLYHEALYQAMVTRNPNLKISLDYEGIRINDTYQNVLETVEAL